MNSTRVCRITSGLVERMRREHHPMADEFAAAMAAGNGYTYEPQGNWVFRISPNV